jgi:group I intron endonuclease
MIEYIYTLNDPITNKVMYIGKTKNIQKRLIRHIYSETHSNKDKWIRELKSKKTFPIIEYLDECKSEDINDLEIYWISQFKYWGFDLLNMTDGGDGGDGKYWMGRKHTKKSVAIMKICSPLRKGIIQYNINGDELGRFRSTRDASVSTGCHRSGISRCCRGISKTCGGFIFRYNKDDIQKNIQKEKSVMKKIHKKKKEKIIQYDLDGCELGVYKTLTEASKLTGCHISLISNCCKKKKYYTVNNTTFRFDKDKFDYIKYDKHTQKLSKKVIKYDLKGNDIQKYNSINLASNENDVHFNHIKRCCDLKYKKTTHGKITQKSIVVKGYTYRYDCDVF